MLAANERGARHFLPDFVTVPSSAPAGSGARMNWLGNPTREVEPNNLPHFLGRLTWVLGFGAIAQPLVYLSASRWTCSN
ncbi:hypothetical protein ACFXTH_019645 [Malus domestica]